MRTIDPLLQYGFTLVELIVGIAILGILLAIAVPAYNGFVKNSCLTTKAVDVVSALQLARAEAVKRNAQAQVSQTGTTSGDWSDGWAVTSGGQTLRVFEPSGCPTTTVTASGNATQIVYDNKGFLLGGTAVDFEICDDRDNTSSGSAPGRQISVSSTGRPSTNSKYVAGCYP